MPTRRKFSLGLTGGGHRNTFAEVRRYIGGQTQQQASDEAIARTTPVLLRLYAPAALWADAPTRPRP